MKKVIEKNNRITAYGFACGYVQLIENEKVHKELYKEHNVYHVRSLYNNTPKLSTIFSGHTSHKFIIWESFPTLSEARKLFSKIK